MPEIHQQIVPMLVEWVTNGNRETQEAACECLATIYKYQHHSPSRAELQKVIMKEMAHSKQWGMRKTWLYFCKYIVQLMPADYFKQHFMKEYLSFAEDKVSNVRREFVYVMLIIKPFFDKDSDLNLEMMDILTKLNMDPDKDVREAAEHVDFELLQNHKKNKDADTKQKEKGEF
jgi:hypothetical protein